MSQQKLDIVDGKYIYFKLAKKQNAKTSIWDIFAKDSEIKSGITPHDILLGQVRWYAQWRQYGFYPEEGTVFEKTCMTEITDFIKNLNVEQRNKKPGSRIFHLACPHCGYNHWNITAKFCPECGKKLPNQPEIDEK